MKKNRCMRNLPDEGPKHYLLTIAKTDDSVQRVGFFFFFPNNNFWERAFTVVSVSEQNLSHVCPSSSPSLHGEEAVWLRSYLVGDTNVFQFTFCHHDCLITRFSVLNLLSTQHALRFISYFITVIIIFVPHPPNLRGILLRGHSSCSTRGGLGQISISSAVAVTCGGLFVCLFAFLCHQNNIKAAQWMLTKNWWENAQGANTVVVLLYVFFFSPLYSYLLLSEFVVSGSVRGTRGGGLSPLWQLRHTWVQPSAHLPVHINLVFTSQCQIILSSWSVLHCCNL